MQRSGNQVLSDTEIAQHFGVTDPRKATRLIATGRLSDRTWSAVASFESNGAKGFAGPRFGDSWFSDEEISHANAFERQLRAAAEEQTLSAASVRELAKKVSVSDSRAYFDVPLTLSGKLAAVVQKPGPEKSVTSPDLRRYDHHANLWAATRLRVFAKQLTPPAAGLTPLERLYRSPAEFRAIRDAAVQQFKRAAFSVTERHAITRDGAQILNVTISRTLPCDQIADGASVAGYAF
jgi:hypothetical protein